VALAVAACQSPSPLVPDYFEVGFTDTDLDGTSGRTSRFNGQAWTYTLGWDLNRRPAVIMDPELRKALLAAAQERHDPHEAPDDETGQPKEDPDSHKGRPYEPKELPKDPEVGDELEVDGVDKTTLGLSVAGAAGLLGVIAWKWPQVAALLIAVLRRLTALMPRRR